MQVRRRVWIAIAIACVGATFYEIPNGRLIWQYALSGRSKHAAPGKRKAAPVVSDEVIATDPEVGDILRYCLGDPNDQELGDLVAQYPENEFFLAQLAERLLDMHGVDRQAALTVADELMTLSPKNAHYRYLKGWILLKPPRDAGDEQEALEQFELGNRLPDFYLPFSKYQDRLDRLCEMSNIGLLDKRKAQPSETGIYFDLSAFLSRLQGPYATIGPETLADLSAAGVAMGQRVIDNGETFGQLEHGGFLLQSAERIRLRAVHLSPEQAWQSRLHLGQALALNEVLQRWYDELLTSGVALMKTGLVAIIPLILTLQLPMMWLFLVVVNLLRGRTDAGPVGVKAFVLFVLGLVALSCLLVLVAFLNKLLPGSSLASVMFVAGPVLVVGPLWLLAHVRPLCNRLLRLRFAQMVMLLFVATGLIRLLWTVPVVPTVLSWVTLLLVGTIAVHSTEHRIIALDALRQFFAKRGQIVVTRTKLLRLTSAVLLICWLVILVGVHLSAGKWQRLETMLTHPLALYGPLPQATQETYHRMIPGEQGTEDYGGQSDTDAAVPEYLHLATRADVEAFLARRQAEGKPPKDITLLRLAMRGGRDIRPVLLAAMEDPNDSEVLLRRARWGDSAVKEQLVTRFEEQFAQLGEPYTQMRQDPNCFQGLLLRVGWGDERAKVALEQRFAAQVTRLFNTPRPEQDRDRLRFELRELVTIHETLANSGAHARARRLARRDQKQADVLERLLANADMLDLEPSAGPAEVASERLESLLDMAAALAFVSEPQEAKARFQWLLAPLAERRRQDRDQFPRPQRGMFSPEGFASCLLYRALKGVPPSEATELLMEYVRAAQPSELFEEQEFPDILARADGRALAEWVLQQVAESPPSEDVSDIPVGRIVNISEKFPTHREDASHKYLEPAFAHLSIASIPLLLEHLTSGHDTLRAFIVWRLTSLGYDWPLEQVRGLLTNANWKVRLNALFACDPEQFGTALADENGIMRAVARLLADTQAHIDPGNEGRH